MVKWLDKLSAEGRGENGVAIAALGYGLTGIFASLWAAVPPMQAALRSLAGA